MPTDTDQRFLADVERPQPGGLRQRPGAGELGLPVRRQHGPEAGGRVQGDLAGTGRLLFRLLSWTLRGNMVQWLFFILSVQWSWVQISSLNVFV